MDKPQELHDLVVVHQGFPAAHNHHGIHLAAGLLTQHIVNHDRLRENLATGQISCHAMQSGRTKSAAHIAASLRGYANAVSIRLAHQHRFDGNAVGKFKQELRGLFIL